MGMIISDAGIHKVLSADGEPRMGSGSTAVAYINTGRRFIGFEKDERYF